MNRIKLSPLASSPVSESDNAAQPKPSAPFAFDKSAIRSDQEVSLFGPLHYEKNYAYPLIVWLHSNGQKSAQLQTILPEVSMRNYVGVAPQAPVGNFQCGYFWEQDFDSVNAAEADIFAAIETACSRFNVAKHRIFLAGLDGGATMALRTALRHPEKFAGVIALNGPMPSEHSVMARWKEARHLPLFWAHHLESIVGQPDADEMSGYFRQLFASGFINMVAREYPTAGLLEKLTPREIDKWIMEQIQSAIV